MFIKLLQNRSLQSLAPTDCLQYFSAATGRVRSFNWQDVAGTATRQLNNQNYNICFRTELVAGQVLFVFLLNPLHTRKYAEKKNCDL